MKAQFRLAEQSVYEGSSQRIGLNSEDEPGDGTVDGDEDDDGETGTQGFIIGGRRLLKP